MNVLEKFYSVMRNVLGENGIAEVCDFGDSYGVLIQTGNKYSCKYLCLKKTDYSVFSFLPNEDVRKFEKRTIIQESQITKGE